MSYGSHCQNHGNEERQLVVRWPYTIHGSGFVLPCALGSLPPKQICTFSGLLLVSKGINSEDKFPNVFCGTVT